MKVAVIGLALVALLVGCGDDGLDAGKGEAIDTLGFNSYIDFDSGSVEVWCYYSNEVAIAGGCGCEIGYVYRQETVNSLTLGLQGQVCQCFPVGNDWATVICMFAEGKEVLTPAVRKKNPGALIAYSKGLPERR